MFTSKCINTEKKFIRLTTKAVLTHITYRVALIILIFYFEKSRNLYLKKLSSFFFLNQFEIHDIYAMYLHTWGYTLLELDSHLDHNKELDTCTLRKC